MEKLEELSLVELGPEEIQKTDGGIWQALVPIAVAGVIYDWADFKQGLIKGLNAN